MVHIAEQTVGRRYAGWFIRNTEHAQRVLDALRAAPLPVHQKPKPAGQPAGQPADGAKDGAPAAPAPAGGKKVAWGSTKAA